MTDYFKGSAFSTLNAGNLGWLQEKKPDSLYSYFLYTCQIMMKVFFFYIYDPTVANVALQMPFLNSGNRICMLFWGDKSSVSHASCKCKNMNFV